MLPILAKLLVFAGVLILAAAVATTCRLIARLARSPVRRRWIAMLAMIAVFIIGYLGYAWAFWNAHRALVDLIVPAIFFLGACFVWLTASLSLQTAVAVLRLTALERENVTDALTGVFNRRYFDVRLREEVARARRYALPFSLLLLDIDHFKHVNDTHGHPAGDKVLEIFAAALKKHLREQDIPARYGGEEFVVLVPHTPHKGALGVAERLRAAVEAQPFRVLGAHGESIELRLTCSIGVASLDARRDSPDTLVRDADANLYRAKSSGRNYVVAGETTA